MRCAMDPVLPARIFPPQTSSPQDARGLVSDSVSLSPLNPSAGIVSRHILNLVVVIVQAGD